MPHIEDHPALLGLPDDGIDCPVRQHDGKLRVEQVRVDIARELIFAFDRMLEKLNKLKNFHHVRLLGTLTSAKGYWDNEIHPKPRGFRKLSKHYEPVLKKLAALTGLIIVLLIIDGTMTYDIFDLEHQSTEFWLALALPIFIFIVILVAEYATPSNNKDNRE